MQFNAIQAEENPKMSLYNFGGINRKRKAARYEFSDMWNITAKEHPCLAPVGRRKEVAKMEHINAATAPDTTNATSINGLTGVADGGFYYNGELKSQKMTLPTDWEWEIERKGNLYIINGYSRNRSQSLIYYYNVDLDEFAEGGEVFRNLIVTTGDTSGIPFIETMYTTKNGVQSYVITTPDGRTIENKDFCNEYLTEYYDKGYTMSKTDNIFEKAYSIGDDITIEGFPADNNGGQAWSLYGDHILAQSGKNTIRNNTVDTDNMPTVKNLSEYSIVTATVQSFRIISKGNGLYAHRMYLTLNNKDGGTLSFVNLSDSDIYVSGISVKKRTRVLDHITAHHGRIWGTAPSGNQIYASASDDIFSFSSQDITKKYAVRIPSDTPGTFTALCSYNNDLLAFKPDSITVVSGTNPTNYTSYDISGVGCISPKSVAVTPDGVIFLGRKGFYFYSGATPRCFSDKLNTAYINATGYFDGESYIVSAEREDGTAEVLTYHLERGLWHKQDDLKAVDFYNFGGGTYCADETTLYKCDATTPGEWSAEFAPTHDNSLDYKGINEIRILADIAPNSVLKVFTSTSGGEWRFHSAFTEQGLNVYKCPVRLELGERYQIKVSGSGSVVIYEAELTKVTSGSRAKAI